MSSNPYIAQHYGSSMELMTGGGRDVDEVDAAVGFSRFPNASHMTHIVFKPKNAAATVADPPRGGGGGGALSNSHLSSNQDALASIRQHRGVLIDNFPSRPQTPKGNNSMLPPLLPADRSSVGSNESWRDRGAGLIRSWVKAAASSSSSSDSTSSTDQPTDRFTRRGVRASPPPLPVTAAAAATHKPVTSPPPPLAAAAAPTVAAAANQADNAVASVSISPMSPNLASKAQTTPANGTPLATPEPERVEQGSVDWMLQRSRAALEEVQRVLGAAPSPGGSVTRALAPPPPLRADTMVGTGALPDGAVDVDVPSPAGADRSPEDSLDYLSPLSLQHHDLHGFPASQRVHDATKASSAFSAIQRGGEATVVPDETRYMVVCALQDPAKMAAQRLRRRFPGAQQQQQQGHHSTSEGLLPGAVLNGSRFPSPAVAPRRIAEVPHSADTLAPPSSLPSAGDFVEGVEAAAAAAFVPLPSSASSSSVLPTTLTAKQPRRTSPPPSPTPAARSSTRPSEQRPVPHALHEDPALLQELADFLRAGNGQGFSTLSAALAAPAVALKTAPPPTTTTTTAMTAISPRTRAQRRRSAPPVAVPPPPVVLVGRAPAPSIPAAAAFSRSFTPSSELARVNTQDGAGMASGVVGAPAPQPSARTHRPGTLPSYAQPTISWLTKSSEASADDFPVTHVPAALTTPPNEARSA